MISIRLAPLAGVTDWPFRQLCFEQGCDCAYTEMVSAMGYFFMPREHHATVSLLTRAPGEKKLILQIFGKEPEVMARAAKALGETGRYDGIDINMGCPVHKVAASGEGSGLMRTPDVAVEVMRQVVKASPLPVSVKMRLGWDERSINVVELARAAEDCGVSEITVHGRTRMQQYAGKADWEWIGRVKQAVKIPVIGNGDIYTADDAMKKLEMSGVDGLMIARGAMGNPWLFHQIRERLNGREAVLPTLREKIETCFRHYDLLLNWKPQEIAVKEMRKHIGWYVYGARGAAQLRDRVNQIDDPVQVRSVLEEFVEISEQRE
ncbi:MAG: tRNA dihydrouridine synthase DusB [Clostridia bacterium]|nr:tRNA dihydrouridine synthase DusB [Clostridia bacterium]